MKKILISVLAATMIGAFFIGCTSNSEPSKVQESQVNLSINAEEMANKLVEEGFVVMPIAVDEAMAEEIYHLNLDNVEEYGIAETGRSPGNSLVMIVKAKEGKVDSVKDSLNKVLEDKIGKAFYPEEKEIAESSEVEVNGNYVSLFILPNEQLEEAKSLYMEQFK